MSSAWLRGPLRHSYRPLGKKRRLLVERLEDRIVPSTLQGHQVFPADNPWNERVDQAPVAANSATLVAAIGTSKPVHPDFGSGQYDGGLIGIPYNVVSGTQAKVHVIIDAYPDESDLVDVPIPGNAVIEADPVTGGDRHLLVYDKDHNMLYELYRAQRPAETGDGHWHADSEAVWDLSKDSFRAPGFTSADAAGLPILPGLIRTDEVLVQGHIDHAIRFTAPATRNAYVFPASHQAGQNNAGLPPMGERFRLKASFDISGFSPANQVILTALKQYGMILADNGSSWFLSGESSPLWDNDDLHNLVRILGSSFEAVDLTPSVSHLSVSSGAAGSQVTISGLNYSGGAGLTKVYFGTVAASSFVINSDNSITAVVPSGTTGTTVDITVRSPYGTSATAAADRFTFADGGVIPPSPPSPPPPAPPPGSAGELDFGRAYYVVSENAGTATFSVRRLFGSAGDVSVSYVVTAQRAGTLGALPVTTGTITFADGVVSRNVSLPIRNDTAKNGDRQFNITLTNPVKGVTLGPNRAAVLRIVDDDTMSRGTVNIAAASYYVSEGAKMLQIVVNRTGGSYGSGTVQFRTQNGTATAGADYKGTAGTLTFANRQTALTIQVPILNDNLAEGDETFTITLISVGGGLTMGTKRSTVATIVDDDGVPAQLPDLAMAYTYELYWPWKKKT